MAVDFSGSGDMSELSMMWPKNLSLGLLNMHFSLFNVIPAN